MAVASDRIWWGAAENGVQHGQAAAVIARVSMRVGMVDLLADLDRLRPAWDRTFQRDPVAPIFMNWAWQRAWCEVSPYPYAVLTVTPPKHDQPVAFLPLSVRGSASALRLDHVREIHMGGDPGSDYNGLVCDPDHEPDVLATLASHFVNHESWDRLVWKEINDPRLRQLVQMLPPTQADFHPRQGTCCPYIQLPSSWEDYLANCLSYETRKSLRKKLRLCEDHCRVTTLNPGSSENAPEQIQALVQLAKSRSRDDMDENVHRCDRIFQWAVEGGFASILVVWHDRTPIAGIGSFIDRKTNSLCFYLTGYNEQYAHYSPGRVVNALAIRQAIEQGFTTLDFLRGDEPYKFQFGAERRYTTHIVAVRRRLHSATRIAVENVRRRLNF